MKRDTLYHAIHEAAHALVGWHFGLTPKQLRVGKKALNKRGDIDFCSPAAVRCDEHRYLAIAVAGKVGTQMLGYNNRLVSTCLARLRPDVEPPDFSDEWQLWDGRAPADEVLAAEDEARRILSQNRTVHLALAQELAAKGEQSGQSSAAGSPVIAVRQAVRRETHPVAVSVARSVTPAPSLDASQHTADTWTPSSG